MSIYTMVAGCELDALVAERVMGCRVVESACHTKDCGCRPDRLHGILGRQWLKEYSTKIAAAWEVAEKVSLFKNCRHLHETREKVQRGGEWVLSDWEWVVEQVFEPLDHNVILGRGETAPLAICRAALQVAEELKAAEENA